MRIGRIRVDITDRNSEKTIALFGRYIKCEYIGGNEYDVLVENERFSDVDPKVNIPYYEPTIQTRKVKVKKQGWVNRRIVHRFKRLQHAPN